MAVRINNIDIDNLIKSYLSGVSELQLSKDHGIDRGTVRKRLLENGIIRRTSKNAAHLRYKNTTEDYRKNLTKKANESAIGRTIPDEERNKMAISLEKSMSRQGRGEKYIYNLLSEKGYIGIPEKAVNRFNIDIAFGKIAVEIKVSTRDPLTHFDWKKIKYLCENGWNVFYIRVDKFEFLSKTHADDIISFLEECRLNPSIRGEYRVIGRYSNIYSRGSLNI